MSNSINDTLKTLRADSSAINTMVYDGIEQVLYVDFKRSAPYSYDGVTPEMAEQVFSAESQGKALNAIVKPVCGYTSLSSEFSLFMEELITADA